MIYKNCKVGIKEGWDGFGRHGRALAEPVWVEQYWLPVLWDDEEDPTFYKLAGINILVKA